MYQKRRYRFIEGRFQKRWDDADEPGWFRTKAEALAAATKTKPEQAAKRGPGRPRKAPGLPPAAEE